MDSVGLTDIPFEAHPFTDVIDISEGNTGLTHAPGTGIHPDKNDLSRGGMAECLEIRLVDIPGVIEWSIHVLDGRLKFIEFSKLFVEL
jgi:hypothetical protein